MDTQTTQTTQVNPIEHFRREFVDGSAISPALYAATVQVRDELETDPYTHEALGWPIHEALGWEEPSRNYQTCKPHRFIAGAFLLQETGEVWQIKPLNPRLARKDGKNGFGDLKPVRYETPRGSGSRACLPLIDPETFKKICDRLDLDHESARAEKESLGGFWAWVASRADLPIVITEGGKKALCLLSHGCIAIALTGCWGAIQAKDDKGARLAQSRLIADLQPFAVPGRKITIALDRDVKRKTRRDVWKATKRTAWLLEQAGCTVAIARWNNAGGRDKGVDDLIVNQGIEAWEQALATARSPKTLDILHRLRNPLGKYQASICVNVPELDKAIDLGSLPSQGIIVLAAGMGTAKTKLIAAMLEKLLALYAGAIAPGHSQALQRGLAGRLGLDFLNDIDSYRGQKIGGNGLRTLRVSLCYDSLLAINLKDYPPGSYILILDEVDQGLYHTFLGGTCSKGGKRSALIAILTELIKNAALVIMASADITEKEIDFVCAVRGEQPFILQNDYQPPGSIINYFMGDPEVEGSDRAALLQLISRLYSDVHRGRKTWIATDGLGWSKVVYQVCLFAGIPADKILLINSETSDEQRQRDFAESANEQAKNYQVVIHSPSLTSGVSIELPDYFYGVYGLFSGQSIAPWYCTQMLKRVRPNVPIAVYARRHGRKSHLSRASNHLKVATDLIGRTMDIANATAGSELLEEVDISSPAAIYTNRAIADHNWAMGDFGLQIRLRLEVAGHNVQDNDPAAMVDVLNQEREHFAEAAAILKAEYKAAKAAIAELPPKQRKPARDALKAKYEQDCRDLLTPKPGQYMGPWQLGQLLPGIAEAIKITDATRLHGRPAITADEASALRKKTHISFADREALERFDLCEFYKIPPESLTIDDVLFDARGKTRRGIARIEVHLWDGLALTRDRSSLTKLRSWGKKLLAQDLPIDTAAKQARELLGWLDIADRCLNEKWSASTPWVAEFADRCKANPKDCDRGFGFWASANQSPVAILGMALRAMMIKTKSTRGTDGTRVYRVDADHLDVIRGILTRRAEDYISQGIEPHPHPLTLTYLGGMEATQEKMADWVQSMGDDAPDDAPDEEWAAECESTIAA
jgi:Domain of unknown function (DUF3854)